SLDDFLQYEAMGNAALKGLPVKALCQYNVKRFLGEIIIKVLKTHSRVLLGLDLYENPFCEPLVPPMGRSNPRAA
ncbi:MAG: MEDS domain-containing protein, partial [Candidatus Bathyarchaeia archaeon]